MFEYAFRALCNHFEIGETDIVVLAYVEKPVSIEDKLSFEQLYSKVFSNDGDDKDITNQAFIGEEPVAFYISDSKYMHLTDHQKSNTRTAGSALLRG